jgi:SynChlorMet cassette radical SAM/SPASM protein ScmF
MENGEQTIESGKRRYPLSQLYFYLTEGCNLKCRHCWVAPKYEGQGKVGTTLDMDLFRNIILQGKSLGLTGVKFTGGEPLMHPQIFELLDIVRKEELTLVVETNGILCTPELAAALKSASKGTFVSVSLDGADAATHEWVRGVPGSFEAALEGIRNLVNAGFHPQIIMTVMQKNRAQMEQVVLLAEQLGVSSVKFNLVQPTERGVAMHKAMETLSIEDLVALGSWVENTLAKSTNIFLDYSHPLAFRPLSKIYGNAGMGCGRCGIRGILGVLANGSYALCGIGESVPELVFGHASTDRLETVWNDSPILEDLREGFPDKFEGICGECVLKGICLGSCIAQNYYTKKNLWAPYWYCEEAEKAGLFPESRLRLKETVKN